MVERYGSLAFQPNTQMRKANIVSAVRAVLAIASVVSTVTVAKFVATALLAVILGWVPANAEAPPPLHGPRESPIGFGGPAETYAASRAPPEVPYHPDAKQPPTPGTGEIIIPGGTADD